MSKKLSRLSDGANYSYINLGLKNMKSEDCNQESTCEFTNRVGLYC